MSRLAFYRPHGEAFEPLAPARGVDRGYQNGVAMGGLLVRAAEALPAAAMSLARLSIDIVRPVPMRPVVVAARATAESADRQWLEAELRMDGEVMARLSALRVRLTESPAAPETSLAYAGPDAAPARAIARGMGPGDALETRLLEGGRETPGPAAYWARINADVVEGEPASPAARAAMVCDIAGSPSTVLDRHAWRYANLDHNVSFTRPPVGDWILTVCETETAGNGSGLVRCRLADAQGPFGRACHTVFVTPRPAR